MEERRATILTVDDEESIRDILCRKLQSLGYNCEVAADGNEALWKAFMHDFDLVLMDVKMPGLSGMEVLPKIITDHPDTCVIMLTAISDIQTAVEAMKLGAYDYLTKPFNLDDLVMRVERALERRRLVLENREYQRQLEQKVEQQAGKIRHYHSAAEDALTREQAALAELEAARLSLSNEPHAEEQEGSPSSRTGPGFTRKLTHLLGGRNTDQLDDAGNGPARPEETSEEGQAQSSHS
jgi:DNA-binding NtrC family response regulator